MRGKELMAAEDRECLSAEVAIWPLVAAVARTASVEWLSRRIPAVAGTTRFICGWHQT